MSRRTFRRTLVTAAATAGIAGALAVTGGGSSTMALLDREDYRRCVDNPGTPPSGAVSGPLSTLPNPSVAGHEPVRRTACGLQYVDPSL